MNSFDMLSFLETGEELFKSLEQETFSCLKNIESMSPDEIERFVIDRQEILDMLEKFDSTLQLQLKRVGWGRETGILEKFRERQALLLHRVIEADGLLLALSEIELSSLTSKRLSISRGRRAMNCYREEGGSSQTSLKRIA